jgi:hypothetical protein
MTNFFIFSTPYKKWSWRQDLNPRPADYKSAALPTELRQHTIFFLERETGLEPATYSLEGCRSTN